MMDREMEKESINQSRMAILNREHAGAAAVLIARAFRTEPVTRAMIDMDHARTRELYPRAAEMMVLTHLAAGHLIVGAMEGSRLVGLAALKHPQGLAGFAERARIVLPRIPPLLPLLGRVKARNLLPVMRVAGKPRDVPAPHYTLDVLAVDPERQGRGLGRRLLTAVDDVTGADATTRGVYLLAGGSRNRAIYERAGYTVVRARDLHGLGVYHMFRASNAG